MSEEGLLLIDIGNTNICISLADERAFLSPLRLETRPGITSHELLCFYRGMSQDYRRPRPGAAIIASVVPELERAVSEFLGSLNVRPVFLKHHMIPIKTAYRRPEELGIDRLVTAFAATRLFGVPVVTVDMGTATTFNCVDKDGTFIGGLISPGLKTSLDSLSQKGSRLPLVREVGSPPRLIANNTVDAMLSGTLHGHASMIDGILSRLWEEMGGPLEVVITGGLSSFVSSLLRTKVRYEPELLQKGLFELSKSILDQ